MNISTIQPTGKVVNYCEINPEEGDFPTTGIFCQLCIFKPIPKNESLISFFSCTIVTIIAFNVLLLYLPHYLILYLSSVIISYYNLDLSVRPSVRLFHISSAVYGPIPSKLGRNVRHRTVQELRSLVSMTTKWLPWKFENADFRTQFGHEGFRFHNQTS